MGKAKRGVRRGKPRTPRLPKRVRQAGKRAALREKNFKKALGIPKHDILPHVVGRGPWRGMRDYAPEENGPVRVRKVAP